MLMQLPYARDSFSLARSTAQASVWFKRYLGGSHAKSGGELEPSQCSLNCGPDELPPREPPTVLFEMQMTTSHHHLRR